MLRLTVCSVCVTVALTATCSAADSSAKSSVSQKSVTQDPVSITLLRQKASDQLRLAATAKVGQEQDQAITALCDLFVVLRSDERYQSNERLKGTAMKVRRRLLTFATSRENQLKRDGIPRPPGMQRQVDEAIRQSLSSDADSVDTTGNGIAAASAAGGAAAGGEWELVELIQRVIAPQFWESVGGPGSMRYFAMRRVLVVRATSDVHQQIKDLLMALR